MDTFVVILLIGSAFLHLSGVAEFDEIYTDEGAGAIYPDLEGVSPHKAKEPMLHTTMQKKLVNILNNARRNVIPPASDMMKVRWDDELARAASTVVDSCFFSISMPENFNLLTDKNVIQATGITKNTSFYLPDAFTQWTELGRANYIYKDFSCETEDVILCKIYKLLTWSEMHKVGCSQKFCPVLYDSFSSSTEKNYIYWKCNYAKIGTFWEDGFSYSSVGAPCTECSHGSGWCYGGLCDDSCSPYTKDCKCVIKSNCNSNGVFSPTKCACKCKGGYSGNSCQLTDAISSSTDVAQPVLSAPLYGSTEDDGSMVLATSTVMPTHVAVLSNFLTGNRAVAKREVREFVEPFTLEETTFFDFTTIEATGSTEEDLTEEATSVEYSTEELTTEEDEEVTTEEATEETSEEMTTEDLTTFDIWSTEPWSTAYPEEETTEDEVTGPEDQEVTAADVTPTEMPTTVAEVTSTELPTTVAEVTSTELPTTAAEVTSTELPTTAAEVTSTELPTTAAEVTSTELPTTTDGITSSELPTTAEGVISTELSTTPSATTGEAATPCSLTCHGEGILDNTTCTCTCDQEGYIYNYTQSACLVCGLESPCSDRGVLDMNNCTCYCASGYRGEYCEEICNVTTTECWEDYVSPESELDDLYCPVYCPECGICPDDISCHNNGYVAKISGFEEVVGMCRCYCPLPWSGLECDECNLQCSNGGTLNSTECSCHCLRGSSGVDCSDTCIQTSMLCTQNALDHCDMPVIAKNCPELCGFCEV